MANLLHKIRYNAIAHRLTVWGILAAVRITAALPSRWILASADALGSVVALVSPRGRRTARRNLRVVFGESLSTDERRAVLRRSSQQLMRAILLFLHLQPLTEKRFRKWVDVPDGLREDPRFERLRTKGGVLVSGHIGNWEILSGTRLVFPEMPVTTILVEALPHRALNEVLSTLRAHHHEKVSATFRQGGAAGAAATVRKGGIAAFLVDRNVRRAHGGVWAPFFGLDARTTPLPAWIAQRHDVPVHPIFCLPIEDGRYRLWVGPDLTEGVPDHLEAGPWRVEVLRRINQVMETLILADPSTWNWTLKRWKSRPTVALGRYPAYSLHDPDPSDAAS